MQEVHHPLGQAPAQHLPHPLGLGLSEELPVAPARLPTHSSLLRLQGGLQALGSSSLAPQALAQPAQQVCTLNALVVHCTGHPGQLNVLGLLFACNACLLVASRMQSGCFLMLKRQRVV